MRRLFAIVMTLMIGFLCADPHEMHALDKTWDNGGATDFWDEDDNWDPDEKPQPADKAIVGGNPEVNTLEIFDELENNGTIDITTGALQPQGDTTNTGTINVGDGSAILSELNLGGSSTISGAGEVVLSNSDNTVSSNATIRGGINVASAVTNASGHTIRGEGSIIQSWINDGTILAAETSGDSSAVLRFDNGAMTNNGQISSASGASINLISYTLTQGVGGSLEADTDSIDLTGVTIIGGELASTGGGTFELTQSNNSLTLTGVTVNAPINNNHTSGNGVIRSNSAGLTNNSTITLNGTSGGVAQFGFTESGTLDGSGEILLVSGDGNSFIGVFPGTPFIFTQDVNHTIRGAGEIVSQMINNGTIRAEVQSGSSLTVKLGITNNGTMEAASGATLRFESTADSTQGAGGVISASDGGKVELFFADITGGTLNTAGSGEIEVETVTLTDVTNSGTLNVPSFDVLTIDGTSFTNNGAVNLNSDSGVFFANLAFKGDTLLDGTGEVVLNTVSQVNNLVVGPGAPSDLVVTHDTNHTIRGKGNIVVDMVNNGRIEGNSAADPVGIFRRLSGTGVLDNVNIGFSSATNTGVHAPGDSAAIVSLEGDYTIGHSLARLEMEIGGLTPGTEHDQLSSTGTVNLGGILDVLALDVGSYTPTGGDRFEIINSTSAINGAFNSVNFPDILGARSVTWLPVDYATDPNKVFLEIATVDFLAGDFDENGMVDNADLAKWEAGFGMSAGATHMDGDADGDFDVDGFDLLAWQRQYGIGVSPFSAVATPIPEPSSLVMMLGFLAILASRRHV